jgi:hypothetical protein
MTKNQDAIRNLSKADTDSAGNLPSMPGIFPDYPARIVRNASSDRELTMTRWDMPSSSRHQWMPPQSARRTRGQGQAGGIQRAAGDGAR